MSALPTSSRPRRVRATGRSTALWPAHTAEIGTSAATKRNCAPALRRREYRRPSSLRPAVRRGSGADRHVRQEINRAVNQVLEAHPEARIVYENLSVASMRFHARWKQAQAEQGVPHVEVVDHASPP